MLPLLAEIQQGAEAPSGRGAARRTLRLEVEAVSPRDSSNALIHNLSRTGLLIETSARLEVGDTLEIELPEAGPTAALVIWSRGEFSGCEFAAPVSNGAVSAALLRAPVEPPELLKPSRPAPLWSDLEADPARPGLAQPNRQALVASLMVALGIALALTAALLSFPLAG